MKYLVQKLILFFILFGCSSFRNEDNTSLEKSMLAEENDFSFIRVNCTNISHLSKGGENIFSNNDDGLKFSKIDCRKNLILVQTEKKEEISFLTDGLPPENVIQYNYVQYQNTLNPGSSVRKLSFYPMKTAGYMNSGQKEKHWDTQKDFKIRYLIVLKNPLEQYKALEIKENGKTTRRYSLNFFN